MQEKMEAGTLEAETISVVRRFGEDFNRQDVDAVMAGMTDDCVFERSTPAPNGTRFEGQAAVRACWEEFFGASGSSTFETEEIFSSGDRCVFRWTHHWTDKSGNPGQLRGVDVIRVRDGKVSEKLAYVKGGGDSYMQR